MSSAAMSVPIGRDDRPSASIETRELYVWFTIALFIADFLKSQPAIDFHALYETVLPSFSVLHLLAWGAVVRLLLIDPRRAPASWRQFLFIGGLALINFFHSRYMTWAAEGLFSGFLFWSARSGSAQRSAAVVLWALFAQAIIGPAIFSALTPYFLRADAALVGVALQATQAGYVWHGNIIEKTGWAIEVANGCSSFHNISLAVLCWVTLTKLRRDTWIRSDFLFAGLSCLAMFVMNAARIYLIAQGPEAKFYWHDGDGAQIFSLAATVVIAAVSQWAPVWERPNVARWAIRAGLLTFLIAPVFFFKFEQSVDRPVADFATATFAVANTAGFQFLATQPISDGDLNFWEFHAASCPRPIWIAITDRTLQARPLRPPVGADSNSRNFFYLGYSSPQPNPITAFLEEVKQRVFEILSLSPFIIDRNMLVIAQPKDCDLPKIDWSTAWRRSFRGSLALRPPADAQN